MDGLYLLAKMRENGIRVPAMIVTAYSDVPHAVKAMKLGAIDFLQKPLRPEDFRSIVADILWFRLVSVNQEIRLRAIPGAEPEAVLR